MLESFGEMSKCPFWPHIYQKNIRIQPKQVKTPIITSKENVIFLLHGKGANEERLPLKGFKERPYLGLFKFNTDGSSLGNPGLVGGIVFSEMSWSTKSRDFLIILEIPLVS